MSKSQANLFLLLASLRLEPPLTFLIRGKHTGSCWPLADPKPFERNYLAVGTGSANGVSGSQT
jgi:hypothetical protein